MSDLPAGTVPDALFAFVMRLADRYVELGEVLIRHDREIAELRDTDGDLGARYSIESELRLAGDEQLRDAIAALDHRLTDVHARALRALNARYGPKETA